MIKIVTLENYHQEIINSKKIILLYFWAEWCGASRILSPIISRLDAEYEDTVLIAAANIDICAKIAKEYNVLSTPTVFVINNGKIKNKAVGAKPIAFYRKMVKEASGKV